MQTTKEEMAISLPLIVQSETVLVDARLLHQKLQVKRDFSTWIKERILEFDFSENQDFISPKLGKTSLFGGRPKKDYHLTLDMAKELAMLERNEIGRNIRRYFIAKEKEVRGLAKSTLTPIKEAFVDVERQKINGRNLVAYRGFLEKSGMNTKSGSVSQRINRYPQHFVKMGNLHYVTEEFALHIYHQTAVYNNRQVMKNSQPVLPSDFGQTNMFEKGGLKNVN